MICNTFYWQQGTNNSELLNIFAGRNSNNPAIEEQVRNIISNVCKNGDEAVLEYTKEYDCKNFNVPLRIPADTIAEAEKNLSAIDKKAITEAAAAIRKFHEAQVEKSWFLTQEDGSIVGQRVLPVDRVGLYVPGGQGGETPLISSLLMNAIPAIVAGVKEIAIVSPPRRDCTISPYILAAAHLLNITEIYLAGGAWSIAALAHGTKSIPKVDVIAGPGNIYVTTAKRLVQGMVGIDMIAGPSEILILADSSANPAYIAADMLSQAEHDELASAICVTDSTELAQKVAAELETLCQTLPRAEIARKALKKWGALVIVPNMQEGIILSNKFAPEHLEVMVQDPWAFLPHIKHAGAVFLGSFTPEAVGDYFAGPNHVLPTMGTARFSSALSVQTFCKKTSIIATTNQFIMQNAKSIAHLARLEGLEAHARSVETRLLHI